MFRACSSSESADANVRARPGSARRKQRPFPLSCSCQVSKQDRQQRGVLPSADRHGSIAAFDVGEGLDNGAPVVASDVSVVPGVVSLGAGCFFQGSVALEGGGSTAAVEDDGSVFCLSTKGNACMSADGLQVVSPGPIHVVSSSLVDGATVSSNCPRVSPLSPPPPRHMGSLTAAISVSLDHIVSCSSCRG